MDLDSNRGISIGRNMISQLRNRFVSAAVLFSMLAIAGFSQAFRGGITRTIGDPSGAVNSHLQTVGCRVVVELLCPRFARCEATKPYGISANPAAELIK